MAEVSAVGETEAIGFLIAFVRKRCGGWRIGNRRVTVVPLTFSHVMEA